MATAYLGIIAYQVDKAAFDTKPTLPQPWNGPPRAIVNVQSLLYASLTAALLSAFLAMLGKQWLSRYASVDMRGSPIQRSQNRQRKLDGVVVWYFDNVLESLPLMLQIALLLLVCALSKYLWGIDHTVASVVLGVTAFGFLFYLFIVVAGAAYNSCPYQTPTTAIIRRAAGLLHSAGMRFKRSEMHVVSVAWWNGVSRDSMAKILRNAVVYPFVLLAAFVGDVIHIGQATLRSLANFTRQARSWSFGTATLALGQVFDDEATGLDFRCTFWMLQTSSDKNVKALTLDFLGTILSLAGLNSTINSKVVVACFDIFSSCFVTRDGGAAIVTKHSEQLAGVSAMCFLRAFASLSSTEPNSPVIGDVSQRYERTFPSGINLHGLPRPIIISTLHLLLAGHRQPTRINIDWKSYNPSVDELVPFSRALAQAAQARYRGGENQPEVPHWLARFALRFLSQDPPPPTSVVADCLTIIAVGLGYAIPNITRVAPDEEYVYTWAMIVSLLTQYQGAA